MTSERELLDLAVSLCEGRVPMDEAIPALVHAAAGSTTAIRAAGNRAAFVAGRNPDDPLARRVSLLLARAVDDAAAHEWRASAGMVRDLRAPVSAPSQVDLAADEPGPEPRRRETPEPSTVAENLAAAARVSGREVIDLERAAAVASEQPRRTLADALAEAARQRGELVDLRDRDDAAAPSAP